MQHFQNSAWKPQLKQFWHIPKWSFDIFSASSIWGCLHLFFIVHLFLIVHLSFAEVATPLYSFNLVQSISLNLFKVHAFQIILNNKCVFLKTIPLAKGSNLILIWPVFAEILHFFIFQSQLQLEVVFIWCICTLWFDPSGYWDIPLLIFRDRLLR